MYEHGLTALDESTKGTDTFSTSLLDFAMVISCAVDLMEKGVYGHGQRVAYIAYRLLEKIRRFDDPLNIVVAAYIHDIGISSFALKEKARNFIVDKEVLCSHCLEGESLVHEVDLLGEIGPIILHHHDDYESNETKMGRAPLESQIIHLADRVEVLIDSESFILDQVEYITSTIREFSGTMFNPILVESFLELSEKESFWLDIVNEYRDFKDFIGCSNNTVKMSKDDVRQFSRLCGRIVDRKSPYTTLHSKHVASIAARLGKTCGMDERDIFCLEIAGELHDLGKLSVPEDILHKPGRLTDGEFRIIKQHTYYTYNLIDRLKTMTKARDWAAFHHEHLDGTGYPFRLKGHELDLGARVLAVSDITAALMEERSYRPRLDKAKVMRILWDQVGDNWIDGDVVKVLQAEYDTIVND